MGCVFCLGFEVFDLFEGVVEVVVFLFVVLYLVYGDVWIMGED